MKRSFQSMSVADSLQIETVLLIYSSVVTCAILFRAPSQQLSKSAQTDDIFVASIGPCQILSLSVQVYSFVAQQFTDGTAVMRCIKSGGEGPSNISIFWGIKEVGAVGQNSHHSLNLEGFWRALPSDSKSNKKRFFPPNYLSRSA